MIYRLQPIVRAIAGREGTAMRRALLHAIRANRIDRDALQYCKYDTSVRGCSPDNPFILTDAEHYVRLEYDIVCYIIDYNPGRGEWMRYRCHGQTIRNSKVIDWLEYVNCTDLYEENEAVWIERYYFDITQCVNKQNIQS